MRRRVGACAWVLGLVLAWAAPVRAALLIDPSLSSLTPAAGPAQPLSGALRVQLGALPPLASNTSFDVTGLAAQAGSLEIGLDPALAFPGAGVLAPSGAFLVPTLFLRVVDGSASFDLAIPNVQGSFGALPGCPARNCLATAFDLDTGGAQGVVHVELYATPEPGTLALLALGLLALSGARRGAR
jgi:hypothetical protein